MDSEQILKEYVIEVGSQKYRFSNVPLAENAIGKWQLTYGAVRLMMLAVARAILAEEDSLTFDQLIFLTKVIDISFSACAKLLSTEEDTLLAWRGDGEVPLEQSRLAREKISVFLHSDLLRSLPAFEKL